MVLEDALTMTSSINAGLWVHIFLMLLSFGLIFPFGMVLGIVRSRWHIPIQIFGGVVTIVAFVLGQMHRKRPSEPKNIHSLFANVLVLILILQGSLGGWLAMRRSASDTRKVGELGRIVLSKTHSWLGKLFPVVAWTQMLSGFIVVMGFCYEDHLGQCIAHFMMGSSFIALGILMAMVILVGQAWLQKTGHNQDFFESIVVAASGCLNTFTEHRWGTSWVKNDLQHTSMGIMWWCGGILGIWLSYPRKGRPPQRSVSTSLVLVLTGWAMTSHPQDVLLSAKIHAAYGWTLIAAGTARVVEITFILRDSYTTDELNSWQHLTPLLCCAAGFLFMGANEEQVQLLSDAHITHVTYVLVLYSIAFLLYLYVNILLHLFASYTLSNDRTSCRGERFMVTPKKLSVQQHRYRALGSQDLGDTEEFELEVLASEAAGSC